MKKINIAIDGYSGTGKSSTAREVARRLGYNYLDTGAMYRAVTYYFIYGKVDIRDNEQVENALKRIKIDFKFDQSLQKSLLYLNNIELDSDLRSMEVSNNVSEVSKLAKVRNKLVQIQREMGTRKGVVMDGRDIGTVVLPDAELKVFMVADVEVRGKRRWQELAEMGVEADLKEIIQNLEARDLQDSQREVSPLKPADDAICIDTSHTSFNQQVQKIIDLAYLKKNSIPT